MTASHLNSVIELHPKIKAINRPHIFTSLVKVFPKTIYGLEYDKYTASSYKAKTLIIDNRYAALQLLKNTLMKGLPRKGEQWKGPFVVF